MWSVNPWFTSRYLSHVMCAKEGNRTQSGCSTNSCRDFVAPCWTFIVLPLMGSHVPSNGLGCLLTHTSAKLRMHQAYHLCDTVDCDHSCIAVWCPHQRLNQHKLLIQGWKKLVRAKFVFLIFWDGCLDTLGSKQKLTVRNANLHSHGMFWHLRAHCVCFLSH